MKTKNLHITKILAFLLVAALLFGGAAQVFRISDDTHSRAEFDTFYRLDKIAWMPYGSVPVRYSRPLYHQKPALIMVCRCMGLERQVNRSR